MGLSEFALIERFFSRCGRLRTDVALGVGDDGALLDCPQDMQLAVTTDVLVEGVHFFPGCPPEALGHKALAVNLSDLAAMGAEPAWATLVLTLPAAEPQWLDGFASALCDLAAAFGVALVGGDTVHGPRSVSLHLSGFVPRGQALRRRGARPGDRLYVTGTLGDAAMALAVRKREVVPPPPEQRAGLDRRLDRPAPRVEAGIALRGVATAAIDISDGLLADLGHLLAASGGLGARIERATIPLSPPLRDYTERTCDWRFPLAGGDDYELCFAVPPSREQALVERAALFNCSFDRIGEVEAKEGIRLVDEAGGLLPLPDGGYDHFAPHG